MKQKNLYAEELWKRNWFMAPMLVVVGIGFSVYFAFVLKTPHDIPLLLAEALGGAGLILIFFGSFRYFSYVQVTDAGLRFNWTFPFSSTLVPFEAIRSTRVGDLRSFYPDNRKSYVNAMTKPLLDKPAFYAKLGGDEASVVRLSRKLGKRYVVDGTIAVPVPDPKSLAQEVSLRLPNRQLQHNLGGAKRPKRKR
ncbi:MAG TPA: hypothetical protein VIP52_05980 [Candidatus Dormibacteraeota bacterium]